jgi:hypothetical protein
MTGLQFIFLFYYLDPLGFGVPVGFGVELGFGVPVGFGVELGFGVPVGFGVELGVPLGLGVGVDINYIFLSLEIYITQK